MSPLLRIPVALVAVVLKLLAPIALWFACMAVAWFAVEFGSMERYSPEDKIHPAFQILVQDEHGIRPMRLEKWQGGQVLVRQETEYRDEDGSGHRLRRIAPDTYELFADLDTAMTTQTRIRLRSTAQDSFSARASMTLARSSKASAHDSRL